MKKVLSKLLFLILFMGTLHFVYAGEIDTWDIHFTSPSNNTTLYNLGYDTMYVDFAWTVSTSSPYWRVELLINGVEFPISYPQSLGRSTLLSIGTHACIIKLYEYNILGQETFIKQDQITIITSKGNEFYIANNFNGGSFKLDNSFPYEIPSAAGYKFYCIPGNHTLSGINGQYDTYGNKRTWMKWTDWRNKTLTSNIDYVALINQNGLDFRACYWEQPEAPSNLHSTINSGNIQIAWLTSGRTRGPNIAHYEIERKSNGGDWMVIGTTSNLNFTDNEIQYDNDPNSNAFDVTVYYRVRAKSTDGIYSDYSNQLTINGRTSPELSEKISIQKIDFSLKQNYPNPFNPTTEISFSIAEPALVKLSVFNSLGQEIATLVNEHKEIGNYNVNWNASNFSSGLYLLRLTAGKFYEQRTMILMK